MLTRQEPAQADREAQTAVQCRHYWIIEPANGRVSEGVCQNCQETREFQNSIIEAEREY